jgi:hypothetical protein
LSCLRPQFAACVDEFRHSRLEPFDQNRAPLFCLDAFSLREPASTSLENAMVNSHRIFDGGETAKLLMKKLQSG